jgi:peptidylprolyl isomerase
MRSWLPAVFGVIIAVLIVSALFYRQQASNAPTGSQESVVATSPGELPTSPPPGSPPSAAAGAPSAATAASATTVDLNVDANGLSKTTVVMNTSEGVVKFKFYSNDAPKTVNRIVELIQKPFYNGLTFHRVVPGFVVQGGDPVGNGTGGSGQKLDAEFNSRRHVEGTVAMARAADPNSADSQFYISLGTHPHLDNNYTVFGQVIEGMDVVKKLKVGDKIITMSLQ